MTTFSLLGMCILRDVFSLGNIKNCSVEYFLQSSNPAVDFIYDTKPETVMRVEEFDHNQKLRDITNFRKKCVLNDYNKTVLDYFKEKSDFFFLDLVAMVHTPIIRELTSDHEHYFTNSAFFSRAFEAGLEEFFKKSCLEKIPITTLWKRLDYRLVLDKYIFWLQNVMGYKPENIIVMENKMVHYYTDGNAFFSLNRDFSKENDMLEEMYTYFAEKCKGCHIIKMPYNVYADKYHIWGVSDLHYCLEYYEYAAECIQIITRESKHAREKMDTLYEKLEKTLMRNTYRLIKASFLYAKNTNWLRGYLRKDVSDRYIGRKGAPYYLKANDVEAKGVLLETVVVFPHGKDHAKLLLNEETVYLDKDAYGTGYTGSGVSFGGGWRTENSTTEVWTMQDSVIIGHNGRKSKVQTQILQIISDNGDLAGKPVVFSVDARVLKSNVEGGGGAIGIIHEKGYNSGIFFTRCDFHNTEWKRISCSAYLPESNKFRGVTVCLRALVAKNTNSYDGAVVEYKNPKLEIGGFPTSV